MKGAKRLLAHMHSPGTAKGIYDSLEGSIIVHIGHFRGHNIEIALSLIKRLFSFLTSSISISERPTYIEVLQWTSVVLMRDGQTADNFKLPA